MQPSISFAAAALIAAVALGCGRTTGGGELAKGSAASSADERLVRDHILANANDPTSVEFAAWGPHEEMPGPVVAKDGQRPKVVRVVYREKNEAGALIRRDTLAFIADGSIFAVHKNEYGDGYGAAYRKFYEQKKVAPPVDERVPMKQTTRKIKPLTSPP